MKKIYLFIALLLTAHQLFATIHEVQVADFQFTPASMNVNVGDTIKWTWVSGSHTTTSVTIPVGASSWNSNMNTTKQTFLYKVTVAGTYDYKCTPHAPFGMVASFTASNILPVTLSSFSISPTKINTAFLQWVTATEKNTDHFDVMRSTDGNHFDKIASVPAKGNSDVLTSYSYTDNNLSSAYRFAYYSLSIVDKDGKTALSGIEIFRNDKGTAKMIVSLSPNPINKPGHLMIQFNSEKQGSMHVDLFDNSGRLVNQTDMAAVAGVNNGHFHMGDVASGTYTIVFTMDGIKESYKVVVQ